jgi:hypothetical protein
MVTMPPVADPNGLAAMLMQLAPLAKQVLDRVRPVLDQPVIRFPYEIPLARSFTVGAGVNNAPMPQVDFSHSLEWPFEIEKVKFSNDPSHTFRDWSVVIKDQTFNQEWMKTATMVDLLIAENTAQRALSFPWVVRPKGGGLTVAVNNLDTENPITVDINFQGYLLIPRV